MNRSLIVLGCLLLGCGPVSRSVRRAEPADVESREAAKFWAEAVNPRRVMWIALAAAMKSDEADKDHEDIRGVASVFATDKRVTAAFIRFGDDEVRLDGRIDFRVRGDDELDFVAVLAVQSENPMTIQYRGRSRRAGMRSFGTGRA